MLPNFTTPVSGTSMEVLENDTTTRDKISLNDLGMTKGESVGVSLILDSSCQQCSTNVVSRRIGLGRTSSRH